MRKKETFCWKQFLKNVAMIAIPVALQNLLTTTGSMVDTIMLAPLGEQVVGSIGLCAQFSSLMFSCYWGFVGGGMLFFGQYFGAKDEKGIDRAYETTLIFMMTVSLIFAVLAGFFPKAVMAIYTDKTSVAEIGFGYLRIVAIAYPLQVFAMAMSALLRSTGQVKIPLIAGGVSTGTNILVNYFLIQGRCGFTALGAKGAAIGTVIAAVVNVVLIILLATAKKYKYLFHFLTSLRLTKEWFKEYLKKCFPILMNELFIGIGFAVTNAVLGRQSEEAIAALAVFRTLEGFVISFFSGFSNAASVLVGQKVGVGDLDNAYEHAKRLILLCGSCIAVVCGVLFSVHSPLLKVMSLSGESYKIGTGFLGIYCIAAVIRMCNWTQNDTFRASGDARYGSIMETSFMYAVVIPAVVLTGLVLKANVFLVFACCYIDEPVRFVLMQRHLYSGKFIKPVTKQGKEALAEFMKRRKKGEESRR